ncbi:class I SAM-dependent methyltransferase [Acetanaerobacterium elongatum]|uniref:Methyltransferase domain-containing protein n=1 Tax=Acetanaerobacterium elongatum TaxID=258515 RepID=A0A1H0DVL0_9FIRM|nr:class I SAM-dependent methyltransferase [Acetanaerobacterium elongatum]SDN74108.1 hypothetical protein SAMN05192585_13034 [Acetanaerobacterium elongatum]
MNNPWKEVSLNDYERHMMHSSVYQAQTLNNIMYHQLNDYKATRLMILGIAGGNGLNHVNVNEREKVYGVDINADYLEECQKRYPDLSGIFEPICADLCSRDTTLPNAELVIADLVIEYIGYEAFQKQIAKIKPHYVSTVIQINEGAEFVSESPYIKALEVLQPVHHQIDIQGLNSTMESILYMNTYTEIIPLANGKKFVRLDYKF